MVGTESDEVRGELPGSPGSECLEVGEGEGGHKRASFPPQVFGTQRAVAPPAGMIQSNIPVLGCGDWENSKTHSGLVAW